MRYLLTVAIILLGILPGCRQLYDGFKTARTEDCHRLPYPEQEECLRQIDGYETYERERDEARRRQ